ncbi:MULTISPECIES: response regulator transcription factor [unclassified Amycolatopsis]|uniref:response regulator transcription factor n=1 Tax=unclassified Amycolatopsis TaxID=2618356 RepID=UPI001FF38EAA|nr:response regulator transcription factor [Amycolatopsis sp. FBCC-B4732]UOX85209.1 response regulator transcription factor [Amycolatopsis sp. FBCC-B4732]
MAKVLVVEDTDSIREVVELALDDACFDVRTAADGDRALAELRAWDPDVVVLDLNIPGPDGLEVCRRLRGFSEAYVVMLTAKSDEVDKLVGLASGADDYLTKPFSPRELVARIQAMLRRPRSFAVPAAGRVVGPVRIDVEARDVTVSGVHVELTRIEFELLDALTENVRAVCGREALRRRAWGESWLADDHAVDVHLSNLRRKLAAAGAPGLIATVRGVGYRIDRGVR